MSWQSGGGWQSSIIVPAATITTATVTNLTATSATISGARVGGTLHSAVYAVATSTTSEEVLATYTLPGGTLSADGDRLVVNAWFTTVNNANTKTGRIRFGGIAGSIVATGNAAVSVAGSSHLTAEIIRSGAATQEAYGQAVTNAASSLNFARVAPTATLANAIDIVVTGTTPTATADMVLRALTVDLYKAP